MLNFYSLLIYQHGGINIFQQKKRFPVLVYHRICADGEKGDSFALEEKRFRQQIDFLKRKGYRTLNTEHYLNLLRQNALPPPKSILITFDDGFKSFFHRVWPILRANEYIALLFLVTGKTGLINDWESHNYQPLLNRREIIQLWNEGVELGAHGHLHQDLSLLNDKELAKEIISSRHPKDVPEVKLHYFSYPYGWFNEEVKEEIEASGFIAGFSVQHGGKDLFEIRRIPIFRKDVMLIFRLKISGYYFFFFDFFKKLKPKFLKNKNG